MKLEMKKIVKTEVEVKYLEVKAGVRYWEDATIDGVEDVLGDLTPFRVGDHWCPVIELETGIIQGWKTGMTAFIHFKICDDGEYWLLDENRKRIAKWSGDYVPDKYLCHGDKGYGDYIILDIDKNGKIIDYKKPRIDCSDWKAI